jgi:hypothetical protein
MADTRRESTNGRDGSYLWKPGEDAGLRDSVPADKRYWADRWSKADRARWRRRGAQPEPTPSHLGVVEGPFPDSYAVCCSGGGVRSAAFNLGALQVLGKTGYLQRARYVAAVSGGSYIAAAIALVAKRDGKEGSYGPLLDKQHPFAPGSPEEQYLRNRSSYMAPGVNGKLRLTLRVIVGLLINVSLILAFLALVGAVLAPLYRWWFPGLIEGVVHPKHGPSHPCKGRDPEPGCQFTADITGPIVLPILALLGLGLVLFVVSILSRPHRDSFREFWETWGLRLILLSVGAAVVLIGLPVLVEVARNLGGRTTETATNGKPPPSIVSTVGLTSIAGVLLTALLQLRARVDEPARVLQGLGTAQRYWRSLGGGLRIVLAYVVAAIAGPLALVVFLVAFVSASLTHTGLYHWVAVGLLALWFAGLMLFGDLTSWSLHPFYRRRLCTAFALRRVATNVREPDAGTRQPATRVRKSGNRAPDAPTLGGGAPEPSGDTTEAGEVRLEQRGYARERERVGDLMLSTTQPDDWPTLLICAAANISDPGATPPGRGVTSFTFSKYTIGGPLVGAMKMSDYETWIKSSRKRDFTLPAAVAMSGAALSPSMGKMTRWPLRFIMALANVRLGVWIPNPRDVAAKELKHQRQSFRPRSHEVVERRFYPRPRATYLARELLGLNHVRQKYLYVTDGGHYENLGLVELLRRGCTHIFCFDASGGESFANLGDAVALARSELQVEIEINPEALVPKGERKLADSDTVVGTITYPDGGPTGILVYSRTVMTANAPWDVHAYHDADGKFPHNTTADQLYTDQKFEAYRALGTTAANNALRLMNPAPANWLRALLPVIASRPVATMRGWLTVGSTAGDREAER